MEKIISFKTAFGWIYATEFNNQITSIGFGKKINKGYSKKLLILKKNIKNFFIKKNKKISTNIQVKGTTTQLKIWNELKKISYGKTKSYGYIATKVKTSPRYVGRVCGQNKFLLVIPCHRVIRNDGSLGGFSGLGGISLKKKLIEFEKL